MCLPSKKDNRSRFLPLLLTTTRPEPLSRERWITARASGSCWPWLSEGSRSALQAAGLPVLDPLRLREHLDLTMSISWTDQGPFLNAGIPAANIGSNSRDAGMEKTIVHSAEDLVGHMQPSSFVSYGRAAERALRTLDEMTLPGAGSMGPFRLKDSAYLSSGLVTLLHFLTFLPFFAILCVDFSKYGKR